MTATDRHCGHWLRRDDATGAWVDQCCRCEATWAAWDGTPDDPCPGGRTPVQIFTFDPTAPSRAPT